MLLLDYRLLSPRSTGNKLGFLVLIAGLIWPLSAMAQGSCGSLSGGVVTCSSTDVIQTADSPTSSPPLSSPEIPTSNYPDQINVPYTGTVTGVKVTLSNIDSFTSGGQESLFYTQVVLVSPGGKALVFLGGLGEGTETLTGLTINFADGNPSAPIEPPTGPASSLPTSGTQNYEPTDILNNEGQGGGVNPELPGTSITLTSSNWAQPDGSATLTGIFSGVAASGDWKLYLADWMGNEVKINGWSLTLTIDQSQLSTITAVTGNTDPAIAGNSVTYTATVTSSGTPVTAGGTVAFYGNGGSTAISACATQPINGSGQATCAVTLTAGTAAQCESTTVPTFPVVCQGGNTEIVAKYSGVNNSGGDYGASTSSSYVQWVGGTITNPQTNQYCNTNPIYAFTDAVATAYPSYITVSGLSASTVSGVSVQLEGISSTSGVSGQFLLVSPDGNHNLDFLDDGFEDTTATPSMNLNFDDTAGQKPDGGTPTNGSSWEAYVNPSTGGHAFAQASGLPTSIPSVPGTITYPASNSSNEFSTVFNGATANGNWALYVTNADGAETTTLANGWCITLTPSGTSTTTAVVSSQNPAAVNQSVTYTATVTITSNGNPVTSGGTVTFLDNGNNPGGTAEQKSLGSGNTASFSSSSLFDQVTLATNTVDVFEGDHTITADYSGAGSDGPSFGSVLERINNPTAITAGSGSSFNACNTGPIYSPQGNQGAFTPNPSIITAANLPGTVQAVTLTLENFSTFASGEANQIESLVEGPTGAALDFFSGTGGASPGALTQGNYAFSDSASSTVPTASFGAGTYKPTSELGGDTYTSGYYTAPSSFTYAQPKGSGTFASVFGNTNPNGNWSLFFDMKTAQDSVGAVNGWCLNFTENAVTVTPTLSHNGTGTGGDFVQGETNAPITVSVENNGTGTAGDPLGSNANPLKVVDTLNSAFTYSTFSGSGWSCSASSQTVTCTNDASSVAQGSSYPQLTIDVNVASNASGSLANSVTVSGADVTSASGNDTIPIDVATVTAANNASTTFSTSSQSVNLTATVTSNGAPLSVGTVTFDVFQGATLIGSGATSGTLNNGVASANYTLPAGTAAGSYSIHATYNGSGSFEVSTDDTAILTINAATATFTWNPPSTIIFGTAGTNVLNATISCGACGSISYTETPSGGSAAPITTTTGLAAGAYTITANFAPSTGNYNSNSTSKQLTISGQSVWVVNSGGGTVELAGNGYAITSSADPGANKAAAIDATGNVWTIGSGSTLLESVSQTGIAQHSISSGGGLDSPSAIATDGDSQLWVTNAGNNSVSVFENNGSAASPSTGYTDSSLSNPSGVAVDLAGSVWIANQGNNSVTRILGAAAPAAPLSTAAANNTTGAKP